MRTIREAAAGERGETLLELLVAVMIMGIGVVAIVGGLVVSIHASDIHRKQATAGAVARNYAEAVENWVAAGNFPACTNFAALAYDAVEGLAAQKRTADPEDPTFPSGYAWGLDVPCPARDGLQKVTVTVSSSDSRASERVTFVVRKAG